MQTAMSLEYLTVTSGQISKCENALKCEYLKLKLIKKVGNFVLGRSNLCHLNIGINVVFFGSTFTFLTMPHL